MDNEAFEKSVSKSSLEVMPILLQFLKIMCVRLKGDIFILNLNYNIKYSLSV